MIWVSRACAPLGSHLFHSCFSASSLSRFLLLWQEKKIKIIANSQTKTLLNQVKKIHCSSVELVRWLVQLRHVVIPHIGVGQRAGFCRQSGVRRKRLGLCVANRAVLLCNWCCDLCLLHQNDLEHDGSLSKPSLLICMKPNGFISILDLGGCFLRGG